MFELFQEAAYPDQAIGRSILGTPDSIGAQTPDDLRRFLATHYRGPETVIAAAGNLDHAAVVAGAREASRLAFHGEIANGGARLLPRRRDDARRVPFRRRRSFSASRRPAITTTRFRRRTSCRPSSAAAWRRDCFRRLREERGLCYSIYSFFWPFADTGIFGIQAATSEEDVAELTPRRCSMSFTR